MSTSTHDNIVTAIDIGSSKVEAVIARVGESPDDIEILGTGYALSNGLKKGVIVNMDETAASINAAVDACKEKAGVPVTSVVAGISGAHIQSFNSNGVVAVNGQEINEHDINQVIDAARAVPLSSDQQVLHIFPQEFIVDNHAGIKDPVGMGGVRLEARVHMVSTENNPTNNIVKCVDQCQLELSNLVMHQIAAGHNSLTEDEKELGVCLVDIGHGTTDILVYKGGAIVHSHVIPIAGYQISNDIAHALRTPYQYADAIKVQHGCVYNSQHHDQQTLEVQGSGHHPSRRIPMRELSSVMEARLIELFELVVLSLREHNLLSQLSAGIVLSGGSSEIPGIEYLVQDVTTLPVRVARQNPRITLPEELKTASHNTLIGLLLYEAAQIQDSMSHSNYQKKSNTRSLNSIKHWFKKYL